MMDSKTSLTNRLFQLQHEAHQLFVLRQRWLQSQSTDIWSCSATGNIGILNECIGKFWPWNKKDKINECNAKGFAPIHLAVMKDQGNVLDLLLSNKADPSLPCVLEFRGWQPLHLAAKKGLIPIATKLLTCGADINAMEAEGRCPLHVSVFNGCEEGKLEQQIKMTEFLLDHGAKINAKTGSRAGCQTALHNAIYFKMPEMVIYLVKRPELDVMICDLDNRSPLYYAVMLGRVDIASLIVGHTSWRPIQDPKNPNHRDNLLKLNIPVNGEEMRKFLRTLAI